MLLHAGDKLVWAAALLQLRRLQLETREVIARPGCDLRLLVVQEAFDSFRAVVLSPVWTQIAIVLMSVFNFLLPSDLQVYVFPVLFPKVGPGTSLGLSILVSGPRDVAPTSFVCNVGHMSMKHDGWYNDLLRTARSAVGIAREFDKADKQQLGLVSNLLCLVPVEGDGGRGRLSYLKEFNFSAWETPKHAFQWYAGSPEHKEILAEHNNGSLTNFGNVLANMQLSKPMRWQARCSRCAGLVSNYPEVRECPCGAPVIEMPLF
uniref:Uncharacterized protein n=1 Tax=Alexandrium catenella TaxID=2925 RepID=A0A7S1PPX7_ALECA